MEEAKKKIMPKWLAIFLLVGGLLLIVSGLIKIFGSVNSGAFVNKFNELQNASARVGTDFKDAGNLLTGISAKEGNKDYAGAVTDLQTVLTKLKDAESQVASNSAILSDFQKMVNRTSKENVKAAGLRFIDLYKQRDAAVLKAAGDVKPFVEVAIAYYQDLAAGKAAKIDAVKFNAMAKQVVADEQAMTQIGAQYDSAVNDLAKAAGFTLKKK